MGGVKQVGDITGNITGYLKRTIERISSIAGSTGTLCETYASVNFSVGSGNQTGTYEFTIVPPNPVPYTGITPDDVFKLYGDVSTITDVLVREVKSYMSGWKELHMTDIWTSYDIDDNVIDTVTLTGYSVTATTLTQTANLNIKKCCENYMCIYTVVF